MKHSNILGKDGLTQTSANHLANIAKEMYEAIQSDLGSLRFHSRDYMLAIAGKTFRVENESEKSRLESLTPDLKEVELSNPLSRIFVKGSRRKSG
ncbi:MAG: hypothetical protein IJV54_09415 [Bacteroidales bacterium]|nr:hypothetical protein [Bacteroidales bacterium]